LHGGFTASIADLGFL